MLTMMKRAALAIRGYWFGKPNAYNAEMVRGSRTTGAISEGLQNNRAKWSARELVRNVGVAEAAVQAYAHRLVGESGPALNMQTGDPALDEAIESLFYRWSQSCTMDGQGLDAAVQLTGRELATVGEAFWYFANEGGRFFIDNFDSECLQGPGIGDGAMSFDGISRDESGKAISYNLSLEDPRFGSGRFEAQRLDAERVLHIFERKRPRQQRGESPFSQIGNIIQMSEKSQRAELGALILSGFMGMHVKTPSTTAPEELEGAFAFGPPQQVGEGPQVSAEDFSLEDGAIHVGNFDIKLLEAGRPGGAYLPFLNSLTRIVAARFGLPFAAVSGDYSQNTGVNGRLEELTSQQHNYRSRSLVTAQMLVPVFRRWLAHNYVSFAGSGRTIEQIVGAATFIWPAAPLLDPLRETQATQAQVGLGIRTWSQACRARGVDPIDQMRAIAKEQQLAREIGVQVPVAGSGQGLVSNPLGDGGGQQGPGDGQQGNANPGTQLNG